MSMTTKHELTYWKDAVKVWFDFYRHKTSQEYVFDGMQGRHLKQLLGKIKAKVVQAGMEPNEANILNSFRGFLSKINDKWLLEHLEISTINSKFNSTYAAAVKSNPFTSSNRINDLVEHKFSNSGTAG